MSQPSSTVSTQTKLRVTTEGNTDVGMNTPLGDFDDDLITTDESPDDLESSAISTELLLNSTSEPEPIISDRPLILYAYFETALARTNLEFFITHGLHDGADFVFILNGNTSAADIIPDEPNIRYVRRPNDCYDLGAFAEVLVATDLYKKYNRFITMNASIRGPFLPYYANGCWSDMYLSRITEKVKVRPLPPFPFKKLVLTSPTKARRHDNELPTIPPTARAIHDLGHRPHRS